MEQQMLKDKVAVITGASYGMGRTMAELFAEEGAAVVITARHQDQLDEVVEGIRAKGGKAVGVVADVCSTEDTKKVFDTALKEFGDVDILINNAGIGEQKMIDETDDDWMMQKLKFLHQIPTSSFRWLKIQSYLLQFLIDGNFYNCYLEHF